MSCIRHIKNIGDRLCQASNKWEKKSQQKPAYVYDNKVDKRDRTFALSDASVVRLEFRSFGAGQTTESELVQTSFLAGSWRSSRLRLQEYLAASSDAALDTLTFPLSKASAATMRSGYFDDVSLLSRYAFQQSITEKTNTPICRNQQDFSITPSELMTKHLSNLVKCKDSANQEVVVALIS
jgi:hypothetical protein